MIAVVIAIQSCKEPTWKNKKHIKQKDSEVQEY